jgi:outer membrane protein
MKSLAFTLLIVNVAVAVFMIYDKMNQPKTAYVNIREVFNGFDLKKDYERKLTITKTQRQAITDSLETELKILGKKIETENGKNKDDINTFSVKRESYFQKKKIFDEDNQAQTEKYDTEIIGQLNQYIRDYGKENGYTYIYGGDGTGSLLYAEDTRNITKEMLGYVNEKYRGEK